MLIETASSPSLFDIEITKTDKNVFIDEFEWVDLYFECDDSSEFNDNVLSYISGYIQRRVIAKEKCEYCIDFLKNSSSTTSSFIEYVNEGGLIKPSEKLDFLVKKNNKILISFEKKSKLIAQKNVTQRICQNVLNMLMECYPSFFSEIDHHDGDLQSHKIKMIKNIVSAFVSLKLKHLAKEKRNDLFSKRIRRTMTKLVAFQKPMIQSLCFIVFLGYLLK